MKTKTINQNKYIELDGFGKFYLIIDSSKMSNKFNIKQLKYNKDLIDKELIIHNTVQEILELSKSKSMVFYSDEYGCKTISCDDLCLIKIIVRRLMDNEILPIDYLELKHGKQIIYKYYYNLGSTGIDCK